MANGPLTEVTSNAACVKKRVIRRPIPKRPGSISAESSAITYSTDFTANFTDGGRLGPAKVTPKIQTLLVTHSSCFPSCSVKAGGVITILGVYRVTCRGGVGLDTEEM